MSTSNSDELVEHMLGLLVCLLEEKVEVEPFQSPVMGFLMSGRQRRLLKWSTSVWLYEYLSSPGAESPHMLSLQ